MHVSICAMFVTDDVFVVCLLAATYGVALSIYASQLVIQILSTYLTAIRPMLTVTSWSGEFKYLFPSHSYQALRKFFLSIGIPTLSPGNIRSSFCEFLLHLPSTHPSYEARHELQSSAAHSAAAGGSVILRHYTKKAKLQLGFQLHDLVVQDFINPAIVEANKLLSSSFPLQEKSIQYPLASDSSDSSLFDINEAEASNSPRELGTGYRLVSKKRKLSYTSQPHEFMIEGPTRLSSTNMDSLPKGFKAALKTSLQIIFRKNISRVDPLVLLA